MDKQVIQSAYGGGARQYDSVMGIEWEPTTDRREIMDWLELGPGQSLLDVCVGTGLNFPHYPGGIQVTGIDFTEGMLEVARKKTTTGGYDVDLHLMDASHMTFDDESFDAVLETYSLCVVPDPVQVMQEMARVCKTGGNVVLFDCVLSEVPSVAKNQQFVRPLCSRLGIPEGVIVWDPTRDYTELVQQIPSLKLMNIKRFDQDDIFKSRCLIQFKKIRR